MENNKMRKSQSNIVRRPLVNAWTDCIFIKTLFQETNPEKKNISRDILSFPCNCIVPLNRVEWLLSWIVKFHKYFFPQLSETRRYKDVDDYYYT